MKNVIGWNKYFTTKTNLDKEDIKQFKQKFKVFLSSKPVAQCLPLWIIDCMVKSLILLVFMNLYGKVCIPLIYYEIVLSLIDVGLPTHPVTPQGIYISCVGLETNGWSVSGSITGKT